MKSTSPVNRVPAAAPWLAAPVIALLAMNSAALAAWSITYPFPGTTYSKWSNVSGQGNTDNSSQTFVFRFVKPNGDVMQEADVTSDAGGNWIKTLTCPENGWFVSDFNYVDCRKDGVQKVKNHPILVVDN